MFPSFWDNRVKLIKCCILGFYRFATSSAAIIVMSNEGHLQQSTLPSSAITSLNKFGEWLLTASFKDEGEGSQRCVDPDLKRNINPLLTKLEISSLVCSLSRSPAALEAQLMLEPVLWKSLGLYCLARLSTSRSTIPEHPRPSIPLPHISA
jgi:hypothetical protein